MEHFSKPHGKQKIKDAMFQKYEENFLYTTKLLILWWGVAKKKKFQTHSISDFFLCNFSPGRDWVNKLPTKLLCLSYNENVNKIRTPGNGVEVNPHNEVKKSPSGSCLGRDQPILVRADQTRKWMQLNLRMN